MFNTIKLNIMIQLTDKIISINNSNTIKAGLQMTFNNGFSISIQFGAGNYCENRNCSKDNSKNVEVAIFDKNDNFYRLESMTDDVVGYVSMDGLADYIQQVKNL